MEELPLRRSPRPLPASLGRRDLPKFRPEAPVRLRRALKPGPQRPRIVSSAHGRLDHMLLCYPGYAAHEYSYRSVYTDLLTRLPAYTRFTVVVHPSVIGELELVLATAGVAQRTTLIEAPEHLNFLVWAEDPYVAVTDTAHEPATTYLLEPYTFTRTGDSLVAELVADTTPVQNFQSPLYFQGGNVLIGDDFVLLGADYPANTFGLIQAHGNISIPARAKPENFVRRLYQRTFDSARRLLYVGTKLPVPEEEARDIVVGGQRWTEILYAGTGTAQPIFHIDMFLTLGGRSPSGKYRVLVGSPALADQILERPPVPQGMAALFDDIARTLARRRFEVIRTPLPITYVDDPVARTRMWYFATSNNCLVEIDDRAGTRRVWLPTYGHGDWSDLDATDQANAALWRALGFEVTLLGNFHPFAQALGAVHCIKKYLERG